MACALCVYDSGDVIISMLKTLNVIMRISVCRASFWDLRCFHAFNGASSCKLILFPEIWYFFKLVLTQIISAHKVQRDVSESVGHFPSKVHCKIRFQEIKTNQLRSQSVNYSHRNVFVRRKLGVCGLCGLSGSLLALLDGVFERDITAVQTCEQMLIRKQRCSSIV